jgi:hypothetical protein
VELRNRTGWGIDTTNEQWVEKCKNDESWCDAEGCQCKGAKKYVDQDNTRWANCYREFCDAICKINRFAWCGLSTGAIVGIVIAVLVVVGGIIGALVYFLCIRKKADA